ncbi:MAG: hypothetical protein JNK56_02780, partial [Myxococcales bacterium]|nr:hypothetical protein [Myxococcales bacterium]
HYFPLRFILLYPAYVVLLYGVACGSVWNGTRSDMGLVGKLGASLGLLLALPFLWLWWSLRLLRRRLADGRPRHNPQLDDRDPSDP